MERRVTRHAAGQAAARCEDGGRDTAFQGRSWKKRVRTEEGGAPLRKRLLRAMGHRDQGLVPTGSSSRQAVGQLEPRGSGEQRKRSEGPVLRKQSARCEFMVDGTALEELTATGEDNAQVPLVDDVHRGALRRCHGGQHAYHVLFEGLDVAREQRCGSNTEHGATRSSNATGAQSPIFLDFSTFSADSPVATSSNQGSTADSESSGTEGTISPTHDLVSRSVRLQRRQNMFRLGPSLPLADSPQLQRLEQPTRFRDESDSANALPEPHTQQRPDQLERQEESDIQPVISESSRDSVQEGGTDSEIGQGEAQRPLSLPTDAWPTREEHGIQVASRGLSRRARVSAESGLGRACRTGDVVSLQSILDTLQRPLPSREYVAAINAARHGDKEDCITLILDHLKPATHNNLAIRLAAKFGMCDVVKELLKLPEVSPNAMDNAAIILACEFGREEVVKVLLRDKRVNAAARNDCPLRWGAQTGSSTIVELLLNDPRVNPSACEDFAIRQASIRGHTNIVSRLLQVPTVNPAAKENRAIRLAVAHRHTEVVRLLAQDPRVDATVRSNAPILRATKHGFTEIVEILLADPRVDPGVQSNLALLQATKNNYEAIVRLLLKSPKVDPTSENNRAIKEAFRRRNHKLTCLLVTRSDVQRELSKSHAIGSGSGSGTIGEEGPKLEVFQAIYHKIIVPRALKFAKIALSWRRSFLKAQKRKGAVQLPDRENIMSKIFAMAFGSELIVSRWEGDSVDQYTQPRAEALLSRLFAIQESD